MKVGPKGKEQIRSHIERMLDDEEKSGVPRAGTIEMMTQWVVALLVNHDREEIQKDLAE